jgi:glycosyltransferase involved in cell wall biosynthesis
MKKKIPYKLLRNITLFDFAYCRNFFLRCICKLNPNSKLAQKYLDFMRASSSKFNFTQKSLDQLFKVEFKGFNIVILSNIDWHYRIQRPQHLALNLSSQKTRIYFVSNTFQLSSQQGFQITEEVNKNIFLCKLYSQGAQRNPYKNIPSQDNINSITKSLGFLLDKLKENKTIFIVNHPFWRRIILPFQNIPLIYDCMDFHAGFENSSKEMQKEEIGLFCEADKVITSSLNLSRHAEKYTNNFIIRNGVDFTFFNKKVKSIKKTSATVRVGYVGSISEWFDTDLLCYLARKRPNLEFILVGSYASVRNLRAIKSLKNIKLIGEKPYSEVPDLISSFDVCIIPFKLTKLIKYTNPVKIYEYMSLGKPVIATNMPELKQINKNLICIGRNKSDFLVKLDGAIDSSNDLESTQKRIKFAKANTWDSRTAQLKKIINNSFKYNL